MLYLLDKPNKHARDLIALKDKVSLSCNIDFPFEFLGFNSLTDEGIGRAAEQVTPCGIVAIPLSSQKPMPRFISAVRKRLSAIWFCSSRFEYPLKHSCVNLEAVKFPDYSQSKSVLINACFLFLRGLEFVGELSPPFDKLYKDFVLTAKMRRWIRICCS